MCSLCQNPVPDRNAWCHLGAIAYDKKIFQGFAERSEHGFACIDCVRNRMPDSFSREAMKEENECDVCEKSLKTKDKRASLQIASNYQRVFQTKRAKLVGCTYDCIAQQIVLPSLNAFFTDHNRRIACAMCKGARNVNTVYLLFITKAGSNQYSEMHLTCRKCLKSDFGWFPMC